MVSFVWHYQVKFLSTPLAPPDLIPRSKESSPLKQNGAVDSLYTQHGCKHTRCRSRSV